MSVIRKVAVKRMRKGVMYGRGSLREEREGVRKGETTYGKGSVSGGVAA
jgi:hypothetical protein